MEKLSRNDLMAIEGGSMWRNIASTIINSIYLVSSVIRLIRRRG